jgi:PAS domain S-box-containing protein
MKDTFYKTVIKNATFGYASHEIIFDKQGKRVDYRITDVNKSFEDLAGISSAFLTGRKTSEAFKNREGASADMAGFYDRLSTNIDSERIEYFAENSKRWYDIQVILCGKDCLTALFEDITCLKSLQSELENTGYLLIENERLVQMSKSLAESEFAQTREITERLKVLEALRESEDKYRSLTEQLPVGVYRTKIDGRLVYSNIALVNILGYDSVEELLKINVSQLYANPASRQKQLKTAEKKTGIVKSEFRLKKKNGELIWVRDNSRLLSDKMGNPVYFDGIIEDITEKKQAEIAVKENEANLKAIIENTLESIWSVNLNYEIQYVNEVFASAFKQTFGVQLSRGVNIIESLPAGLAVLWKGRYERAFLNEHFSFEDKIDINSASIYIEVAMNPIVVDNQVVGVSVYGRDVTEKKRIELQLQYQADLRKLLIELSSGFINIPVKDINEAINHSLIKIGKFVGADRVYILEYDFHKNTVTNTFEWCGPEIEAAINKVQNLELDLIMDFVTAHRKGDVFKIEDVKQMPENSLRNIIEDQNVVSLLTIPLILGGECIGSVGFDAVGKKHVYNDYEQQLLQVYAQTLVNAMDRLEKEQKLIAAKEKAEESDRLKSAFLANMSHEIRTPMSGIIGFLNLLNEPDLTDENKTAYISIVTQSGLRLLDTINDIIEISRIESGGLQVNMNEVSVSELFGYYDGFFRQQTTQKGLEYTVCNSIPANISYFRTDRKKLDSIISNLIKNAIKFTPSGSIEFGCRLEEPDIVFYVKDSGVGIPQERLNSIFDRFVQGDLSTTRPHEGSGLGLAIVKAYIEMLKGKIMVQSKEGTGTTFIFTIPYLPAEEIKTSIAETGISDQVIMSGTKILIAEDDYASYLYIHRALAGEGITFLRTTNGEDTVKIVKENADISVVLMDIKMPGMTGLEAARSIREFNKSVPIIAQTAYSLTGDRELAMEAGCTDYISKPINRRELHNMVKKYTGKKL